MKYLMTKNCIFQLVWPLSGHCSVCINHPAQNFKGWLRKTLNRRHFHLYRYLSYKSPKPAWICRFWLCPSIYILKIDEKNCCRYRKSLERKQTQVKPNANIGWPVKPVNHIRPQLTILCPNSSWAPNSQNADGAPPYWGFQPYVSVWPLKCKCVSLLRWWKQAECIAHFPIKKWTNLVTMVPHANWHNQTSEHKLWWQWHDTRNF